MYIYDTPTRIRRTYIKGLLSGIAISLFVLCVFFALAGFKVSKIIEIQQEQAMIYSTLDDIIDPVIRPKKTPLDNAD